jgi:PAS domain-containing protein
MKVKLTEKKSPVIPDHNLRKRAEKRISTSPEGGGEISIEKMTSEEIRKLIQELRIYHVELEMQNEALRSSQTETSESRRRYEELFNFAPVGYFTLDKKGHIKEANVTGASLLGFEKRSLMEGISIVLSCLNISASFMPIFFKPAKGMAKSLAG